MSESGERPFARPLINPRPDPVYIVCTMPSGRSLRVVSHPTNGCSWDLRDEHGRLVAVGRFDDDATLGMLDVPMRS